MDIKRTNVGTCLVFCLFKKGITKDKSINTSTEPGDDAQRHPKHIGCI